jgi:hypothetical protein
MDWVTSCRNTTWVSSPAALVAQKPWLGLGRNADMAADSPPAIGAKGGKCAGVGGGAVRGNCRSWGPSRSRQPLRMGWLSGWKTVTNVLLKTILQPWPAKGPKPMRVWEKEGMTWPDIVAGGSAEMEARVALATECLGHPLATVTPTVGARGL